MRGEGIDGHHCAPRNRELKAGRRINAPYATGRALPGQRRTSDPDDRSIAGKERAGPEATLDTPPLPPMLAPMSAPLPLALVTNDDGFQSPFLEVLIGALAARFRVVVAVPEREQSWIGRALSRHREVTVRPATMAGATGWIIDGTPSDCVNLAMGHLLAGERPAVVVSGLNIGYNTTVPMLLSSGTLAGAIEGAHWRLPALACSQALPKAAFASVQSDRSRLPAELAPIVAASCAHVAEAATVIAAGAVDAFIVHNLNYPIGMTPGTEVCATVPAAVDSRCLFEPSGAGRYRFAYRTGHDQPSPLPTDRETLLAGRVSWTRLNFSSLAPSIEIPDLLPSNDHTHVV